MDLRICPQWDHETLIIFWGLSDTKHVSTHRSTMLTSTILPSKEPRIFTRFRKSTAAKILSGKHRFMVSVNFMASWVVTLIGFVCWGRTSVLGRNFAHFGRSSPWIRGGEVYTRHPPALGLTSGQRHRHLSYSEVIDRSITMLAEHIWDIAINIITQWESQMSAQCVMVHTYLVNFYINPIVNIQ